MQTKTPHRQSPSKFESKTRRVAKHARDKKVNQAKDQDWKRDALDLFGYTSK